MKILVNLFIYPFFQKTKKKKVNYDRVPITDEQAPEDEDFDVVFKRVKNAPKKGQLVFNCQMGRGRTTTGMTVGVMWRSLMGGDHVVLGKKRFIISFFCFCFDLFIILYICFVILIGEPK